MKTVINNIYNTFPVSLHNNRQAVFITQPETAGTLLEFITEAELTGVGRCWTELQHNRLLQFLGDEFCYCHLSLVSECLEVTAESVSFTELSAFRLDGFLDIKQKEEEEVR